MAALSRHGFNALQSAAIGANTTPVEQNLAVLTLLVQAGSPLEQRSRDGRTALFLAAEFAPTTDAVRLLLDAGAEADVTSSAGHHVLHNAMTPAVAELLSRVTGRPVPPPAAPEPDPVPMRAARWRAVSAKIGTAFEALTDAAGGAAAGLHGFCFYTQQDTMRAKRTSRLPMAIWVLRRAIRAT